MAACDAESETLGPNGKSFSPFTSSLIEVLKRKSQQTFSVEDINTEIGLLMSEKRASHKPKDERKHIHQPILSHFEGAEDIKLTDYISKPL
jgi:hypothetical protein